jgi:glycosyltransferase involved in cell wall biosynthesis
MKLICVAPYYYPSVGGVQNYVLNICRGLRDDYRDDVIIITTGAKDGTVQKDTFEGMTRYHLPYQFRVSNTPISFAWQSQIRQIIRDEQPALMIAHTPVPFMADMAIRAADSLPTVLTYHNDLTKQSFVGKILSNVFYRLLSNATLQRASSIIATSQYYADTSPYLQQYQAKTSIVTPGVDSTMFHSSVDRQWLHGQYGPKKIVLFVGILEKTHTHKGVDVLVKAVAQAKATNPDIQLIVAGKGNAVPSYRRLAESLGIANDVSFPGFISDEDLPKYYAGADVFTLPSTNQAEGFGMVLVEAQACQTPVIGSRVGGIPFVIRDKQTGLLVEPGNVTQLAAAIETVLTTNTSGMTQQAVKRIDRHFGWQAQVTKTQQLITKLVP